MKGKAEGIHTERGWKGTKVALRLNTNVMTFNAIFQVFSYPNGSSYSLVIFIANPLERPLDECYQFCINRWVFVPKCHPVIKSCLLKDGII